MDGPKAENTISKLCGVKFHRRRPQLFLTEKVKRLIKVIDASLSSRLSLLLPLLLVLLLLLVVVVVNVVVVVVVFEVVVVVVVNGFNFLVDSA